MNEHIKKLFDRALDQAVPETWTTLSHEQITKLSEVFAELIIQECLKIAKNREDEFESAGLLNESNAVGNVAYRISRQFGVKR